MDVLFLNPPALSEKAEREARARLSIEILNKRFEKIEDRKDNRWEAWVNMHKEMFQALTEDNLMTFQSHPSIAPQITGGSGRHYLTKISEEFGQSFLSLLLKNHTETLCGDPKDLVSEQGAYITITSMRHLYHLSQIHQISKNCLTLPACFLEIGGGFGNLARMVLQYNLANKYFIIDHPVLNAIQYYYLGEFFPLKDIAIIAEDGNYITGTDESNIRLYSIFGYEKLFLDLVRPYFLVSMMALTEIPSKGQNQYLKDFPSDYIYIFGQLKNIAVGPGGKSGAKLQFSNEDLVLALGSMYHTLKYRYFGYHFEYIGRKPSSILLRY